MYVKNTTDKRKQFMPVEKKILPLLIVVIIAILFFATLARSLFKAKHLATEHMRDSSDASQFVFFDVPYGPNLKHGANLLDLRLPTKGKPPFPLIILIHGGGWTSGDKSMFPSLLLLSHGYATASINYSLKGPNRFPAEIKDCKAAVAWLRSHANSLNLDGHRIGVWGASAGGHLAALLGTTGDAQSPDWAAPAPGTSNRVDAICTCCGPSDLLTIDSQADPKNYIIKYVANFIGALPSQRPDLAKAASPVTYVHKGCPPFLIIHGQDDTLVPSAQSNELNDSLKKQGVYSTLELIPKTGHNLYSVDIEQKIVNFFDGTLKGKR